MRIRLISLILIVLFALIAAGCGAPSPETVVTEEKPEPAVQPAATEPPPAEKKVFVSPLAGRWYPASPAELKADLDSYFAEAPANLPDNVSALILPHAGYSFSGAAAAAAMKSIEGRNFSRVIVLGPSHSVPMRNAASVPDATHYATPLGETPLDLEAINYLKKFPQFGTVPAAHDGEHSVQIIVPMLQHVLRDFELLPIIVGQLDDEAARVIGRTVAGLITRDTLVIASTDFTHYGPRFQYVPFDNDVPENIEKLDFGAWEFIAGKDLEGFTQYVDQTGATICGRHAVSVLLAMLPEDFSPHKAAYTTSGNLTGDFSNSVSYLSALFTGTWPDVQPIAASAPQAPSPLTDEDKAQLLKLARGALEEHVRNGNRATPESLGVTITPAMENVMGAFVTLNLAGQLRGCIGEISPRRPLYQAVMDHAVNSAVNDRRFRPVSAAELPQIEVDISALTEPVPVSGYNDILIGKHGVVMEKSGRTSVFLPYVPVEQGWDLEQTLVNLALKVGLPRDAWRQGASFTVFESIDFGESDY